MYHQLVLIYFPFLIVRCHLSFVNTCFCLAVKLDLFARPCYLAVKLDLFARPCYYDLIMVDVFLVGIFCCLRCDYVKGSCKLFTQRGR